MENPENICGQSAAPEADSVVNGNPVDISVLKKESQKNPIQNTENICGQSAAPDKTKESDKKVNENESDLDKQHKKKLEVSKVKVIY